MRPRDLLHTRPEGLYCPPGDFYIDPSRPVARALITHGHSDHARAGHGAVLATQQTLDVMAIRYSDNFAGSTQAAALGETDQRHRRRCGLSPGRPCHRLGADRG
jgi:putative mRNA 3-end processing factor